jgi:hypothetical protein
MNVDMYDIFVNGRYHYTTSNYSIACDNARALCLESGEYSSVRTQDMNKLVFAVSYSAFNGKLIEYIA